MQERQTKETEELEQKFQHGIEILKVKPKKQLKEYQTTEKLVSVVERVEEAYNFRKELKCMEINEKLRIENLIQEKQKVECVNLAKKHEQEESLLKVKLQNFENNLIIQMKKELQLLQKQVTLHELDIKQIQNILTKYNYQKAITEGEAKRNKLRSRQQNDIISNSKKTLNLMENAIERERPQTAVTKQKKNDKPNQTESAPNKNIFLKQRPQSAAYTLYIQRNHINQESSNSFLGNSPSQKQQMVSQLKAISASKDISKFYLRGKYGSNLPVNFIPVQQKQNHESKKELIDKFLKDKKPDSKNLYNENLEEIKANNLILDEKLQNTKIKNFLDQKMNATKKLKK